MLNEFQEPQLIWDLDGILKRYGLTAYKLAEEMDGNTRTVRNQLYKMKNNELLSRKSLINVVSTLRDITGEEITVADLLVYKPPTETISQQPVMN